MKQDTSRRSLQSYIWTFVGVEKDIIKDCKTDRFHATVIATLLFLVGVYAILAWTFFFQNVTDNIFVAIIGAIFMGTFIVCFDRALIASLSAGKSTYASLGFRLILALLLGVFLAQPMILKMYEPEVKREAQILMDQKVLERKAEYAKIYETEMTELSDQKLALESQLNLKTQALATAENDFKTEMDGSGGTERYGYSTVAKQKEKILKRHESEYATLLATNTPQINQIQNDITALQAKITIETESFGTENAKMGTMIQAAALKSLIDKDETHTLRNRFLLLTLILTLIELSALIAKMLFRMESYRSQIALINTHEIRRAEVDEELFLAKIDKYRELALHNEIDIMEDFYSKSRDINDEKLDGLLEEWKTSEDGTLKGYWQEFEKKFLVQG